MNPERRTLSVAMAVLEVRASNDQPPVITGYAARYYDGTAGTEFFLWDQAYERIMPGAFDGVLNSDVRVLFNHDPNYVLGRTAAGTARIFADEKGLRFEATPPESRADVIEAIRRGDVSGCSFSFSVGRDSGGEVVWREIDGMEIREIVKIGTLYDVGPVTFPAYTATDISARSAEFREEREQLEKQRHDAAKLAMRDAVKIDLALMEARIADAMRRGRCPAGDPA